MKGNRYVKSWFLLTVMASCLQPYQAPDVKVDLGALVVDGFLNLDANTASVRLSRTVKLASAVAPAAERQAIVKLEEIGVGIIKVMPETQNGLYTTSGLNLSISKKYRFTIQTKQNRYYATDEIAIKRSPPIDKVYWEPEEDGIHIYVDSHDPTNSSVYYMWDYVETWRHDAPYDPTYRVQNGLIVKRPDAEHAYKCYTTVASSGISILSTKKLSQDVVSRYLIAIIPKGSIKVSLKYSIIVNQQAITEESFIFWQQLKKTTENLGGLFDSQPSQLTGNIHNINDATEPVMGYVTGGSLSSTRIFIDGGQVPESLRNTVNQFPECRLDTIKGALTNYNGVLINNPELPTMGEPLLFSSGRCVDCRLDGGTTTKPDFWP